MSIGAKPWEGGGAASVPDASETVKGKIRIATSAEAATGTDDLTAMTPLTVKERIDAAVTGGVEYKGTFNATAGTPSLANAEKGDLYIIDTAGTIYGQDWSIGDHLLINADMGGSITNSKIDKIDNTNEDASETVKGVVQLATDAEAQAASVSTKALVPSNIGSIDVGDLNDDGTYLKDLIDDTTPELGGNLITNGFSITSSGSEDVIIDPDGIGEISIGADIMPDANATHTIGDENTRFISAYTDINGAIRFKAKNDQGSAITKGQAVYIKGVSGTVPTVGLARANSASTMPAFGLALENANDQAEVQIITFGNLTDVNTTTYSLSAGDTVYVSATAAGSLTNSAPASESNLIQNIGRVVRADASAGIIKVGGAGRSNATPNLDQDKIFLGDASNQAVSTALSAINLSSFNDDLTSTYQPLDAGLTSISGLTTSADKMIYTTASDTYAVTPISAAGRSFVSANDAGAQRSALSLGTAATSDTGDFLASTAAVGDLSDVTITSVSNGQVLSYNSTSGDWENTTPASGGATDLDGLSDVTITSATGGDLLQNNGSGQFVNVAKSSIDVGTFNDDGTYQASDAGLTSIAGLTTAADKMIYTTASDTYATTSLTAFGRALLDDADATTARSTLSLGTAATSDSGDFQPIDAGLTSISGLTTAANKMIYTTGSDTYAVTDLTSAGRALLDDADATAQRTTLGLGTAATSDSGDFLASTAGLNDLADVSFTAGAGIDNYILTYDNSTTSWGAEAAPTAAAASETTAGVIEIATNAEAQAALATDKALVPSNIGSIDTGDLNDDGTYLKNLSEDTTPQLGADLDVNGNVITSASNGLVEITPNGTGAVKLGGNDNPAELRFFDEAGTNYIALKAPADASISADETFTLPATDGTNGQVLQTNGSGVLSFVDQSGGGGGGLAYTAITADPAPALANKHYSCTGTFTITLDTSGYTAGDQIRIKNMGSGTITIDPQTGTIDGSTTDYTLDVQYSAITLVSTGTNWEII